MPDPTLADTTAPTELIEDIADSTSTAQPGPPAAPTGLRVTTLPDERLQLDWNAASGVESWDVLDRLNTAEPVKDTVTVPRSVRSVLHPGSHRRYAVRARNTAGVSPLGDSLDVPGGVTPIQPPGLDGAPGGLLDLSRWYLTLPITDPGGHDTSRPWDVYQPDLGTFTRPDYFRAVAGGGVEYTAPTKGVTTPGAEATRCELREMAGPSRTQKAAWSFDDGKQHILTCTLTCDGTSVHGRQEVIVGQIHGPGGTPPLILCLNHTRGGALEVFRQGPRQGDLLTGLAPGELFTYRIEAANGRLRLWAARGRVDRLPEAPGFDWPASDLTERSGLYFKAGAYNKQDVNTTPGGAIVRHHRLDLV